MRITRVRSIKYLSYLSLMLVLTGCWDQREIDKKAYVVALGMDKAKEEGKIEISLLIANPEFGSTQEGGATNEPAQEMITLSANDLITAKNMANTIIAKEITYDLLRVFIVSEELAQDNNFIRWMYDATKDREVRRDNYFIVSKEKASEFIERNKPKLETRAHSYFNFIIKRGIETGMIPASELHWYFKISEADADLFLAMYATTKKENEKMDPDEDDIFAGELKANGNANRTQFIGSTVFKEGRMLGKLTGDETLLTILLNDTLHTSDVLATFPDPTNKKYRVAAKVQKTTKNEVKMKLKVREGTIDVTVPLIIEVLSDHNMVNYAKDYQKRKQLKQAIKETLTSKFKKLIKKSQEEWKAEPFSWSLVARKHFDSIPEYEKYDWMKSYPNMNVQVNVDIKLGEFGRQAELPELQEMRD